MSRESPSLEWFSVRYYAARGRKIQILPALFSNVAPYLMAFHALKCFDFSMSTSLLSNIRIFTFCAAHTVPMIFSLLKSMPRLTHLRMDGLDGYNNITLVPIEEKDLTMIDLPLLESLQIHGRHCSTLLAFLRHITPSPRCRLFSNPFSGIQNVEPHPSAAYDAILIWLRAFTNKHPPKYIQVLAVSCRIPTHEDGEGGEDCIRLHICDSNEPSTVEEAQLGAEIVLDTHGRSFIRELAPSFAAVERLCLLGTHFVSRDLYLLYQAFPSVTELEIRGTDIDFEPEAVCTRDGEESPLFPLLHTVIPRRFYGSNLDRIADFLEYRVRIGLPVSVLDLSAKSHPVWKDDRLRLCKIEGLSILWPTGRWQGLLTPAPGRWTRPNENAITCKRTSGT
ncbi:hypothetical protein CPC08DRAFT_767087 [Agrocybe pediades]|nr:hypothetical protein CPC08DRAFT_767087 [Agrocybe pediades]